MEPYPAIRAFMTCKADKEGEWYLDFCTSRYICNNHKIFGNFCLKIYKFITTGGNIIKLKYVRTVIFSLENGTLALSNIAYVPECDFNFISLGQLQETDISYHDHPKYMVLKERGKIIGLATKRKNLFILNIQISGKTMLFKERGKLTYFLGKNIQIRL